MIEPDWPAPPRVRALVTTRAMGDMARGEGRQRLRALLPAEPGWLRQVHGTTVVEIDSSSFAPPDADAALARRPGKVCAVLAADCMPVLLADREASVVGVAHAGWRGLCAGVLEATLDAMDTDPAKLLAWLGPAIGPRVYEVGTEVRGRFIEEDPKAAEAFVAVRPGHWLLDLYAVARQRLERRGVRDIHGGGYCTYSDERRFFSHRRSRTGERMAAAIWLT